jgi:hypothetical protein
MLGFFDDTEDGPCTLVMLYVGDPLFDQPEHIFSVSDLYVSRTRARFDVPTLNSPLYK